MIRLTCAQCQAQIEVDDAFAGGVCRCKHCATIQTVPRSNRPGTVGTAVAGDGRGGDGRGGDGRGDDEPRTLYQVKSRAGLASTPSGLEELAEAVHGSGLVGSGLLNRTPPRVPQGVVARPRSTRWVWAGVAAGVLAGGVLAGVGYFSWLAGATSGGSSATADAAARPPAFAGVPLLGKKVAYVLDRGDATAAFFPALRDLTVKSVRSLGPGRQFQVVLWDNGSVDAFPPLLPGDATAEQADKLERWFDAVNTGRVTDVLPALKLAVATSPDTVVLATGKSLQLDDAFAEAVLKARGRAVVQTFTLGRSAPDDPLRRIAAGSSGRFTALDENTIATLP